MQSSTRSILGPTLWNIYNVEVLRVDTIEDTDILCSADYTAIVGTANSKQILIRKAIIAMDTVAVEIKDRELELANDKTEMVIHNGGRKLKNG